jgi:alkylation response protein AidB-like acyl-CoA dehydrogenase
MTDEQKLIQEKARIFALNELGPVAGILDENGDRDIFLKNLTKMAQMGFMGVNIKKKYGGSEAGVLSFSIIITELARACASSALTVSVNNMCCEVLQAIGTEEQKMAYIPKICSGKYYAGGFCLTEATAGSDPSGLRTTAVQDGNEWILNGNKMFITSAEYAGIFLVWAITDPGAPKGKGVSIFLVENGTKGLIIGKPEIKMGQRGSITNEVAFTDCRIPKKALLGQINNGIKVAAAELAGGRIGVGSLALGIGLAAIEFATKYAKNRVQFDKPITEFQAIQWMIAESYTELEAARLLLMEAAFKKENGITCRREVSMAKYYATEVAIKACYNAMQMLGGYGYTKQYPIERYCRDIRITSIYEGTNEIQRRIISKDIIDAV